MMMSVLLSSSSQKDVTERVGASFEASRSEHPSTLPGTPSERTLSPNKRVTAPARFFFNPGTPTEEGDRRRFSGCRVPDPLRQGPVRLRRAGGLDRAQPSRRAR